jgi:hypothetical protein
MKHAIALALLLTCAEAQHEQSQAALAVAHITKQGLLYGVFERGHLNEAKFERKTAKNRKAFLRYIEANEAVNQTCTPEVTR